MSVSHPYLKQLKYYVLDLCKNDGEIGDSNPNLFYFCKALEDILCNGLKGGRKNDLVCNKYWKWFETLLDHYPIAELSSAVQFCLEYARKCQKTQTDLGRGRLAIRSCLNRGLLSKCIRLLRADKMLLLTHYEDISIIGDEIMGELFISLLVPLESTAKFALNLRVCSFLDETWELPCLRRYEMVPCDSIGLNILTVDSRIIVTEVESGSVADEDIKIEPGDILDDLFGESLRGATVGKTMRMLADFKGAPIYLSVIKCLNPNGSFYRPIFPYLEAVGLDKTTILSWREKRLKEIRETNKELCLDPDVQEATDAVETTEEDSELTPNGMFKCQVLGYINVGEVGTVDFIESGVISVVQSCPENEKRDVLLHMGETEVTVYCAKDPAVILLEHSYPEIASCGRRTDYPLNFSYIGGDANCNFARKFFCYVFEAKSNEQAKTILKCIADGFERTHWAV